MTPDPYQRRIELPNSTATLILGIMSIISCFCFGLLGFLLGIVALAISGESKRLYQENPDLYTGYENIKVGRTCAIIGITMSSVFLLLVAVYIIAILFGISMLSLPMVRTF